MFRFIPFAAALLLATTLPANAGLYETPPGGWGVHDNSQPPVTRPTPARPAQGR